VSDKNVVPVCSRFRVSAGLVGVLWLWMLVAPGVLSSPQAKHSASVFDASALFYLIGMLVHWTASLAFYLRCGWRCVADMGGVMVMKRRGTVRVLVAGRLRRLRPKGWV
jgi:hypothetical protein